MGSPHSRPPKLGWVSGVLKLTPLGPTWRQSAPPSHWFSACAAMGSGKRLGGQERRTSQHPLSLLISRRLSDQAWRQSTSSWWLPRPLLSPRREPQPLASASCPPSWTRPFMPTSLTTPPTPSTKLVSFVWIGKGQVIGWEPSPAKPSVSTSITRSSSTPLGDDWGSLSTLRKGPALQGRAKARWTSWASIVSTALSGESGSPATTTYATPSTMQPKWQLLPPAKSKCILSLGTVGSDQLASSSHSGIRGRTPVWTSW